MKKHLLCTSAIIGCAMAAPATAQEWDLSWGGFMNQHVAFADVSGTAVTAFAPAADYDGLGFHSNTEIIFTPSITLDNGLTFGINVQFEGEGQSLGNEIDETYMTISSDTMGQIIAGSKNSAGYMQQVSAPGVTSMAIQSPSISAFIPFSAGGILAGAATTASPEVAGNNDPDRLTYFTPSFNGLTLGVSYARNDGGTSTQNHNNSGTAGTATVEDIFDISLAYSQTFGTTSVDFSARYGTANLIVGGSDPEVWGVGLQVGFGDFTIGGSYTSEDPGGVGGPVTALGNYVDSEGYSFGVVYDAAGPWAFEGQMYMGETKYTDTKAEYNAYRIGASRDLGPGVDWDIYAAYVEADVKSFAGTEIKGTVIGTAINLSF